MVTWSPGSRELNFLHMKGISALMKARGDHEASYQGLRLLWTVCLLIVCPLLLSLTGINLTLP